jgi:UDP-N-acetyl-D-galactosamine dehydrogenase
MIFEKKNLKLAIIGLGYVGLPLAIEFSKKRETIAFDINIKRVNELNSGKDRNKEIELKKLKSIKKLKFTSKVNDIKSSNFFIITVPTPINKNKKPDLSPLLSATDLIGKIIKKNDIIVYESTVYPGCIEEICVPRLEKLSKLKFNKDFFCGYSPERINPGDKEHTISKIKKITSGSSLSTAKYIDSIYKEIISAGTHKAPSIKIAEAAKVIENTQRDLNIALINELSILFNKLNIDTHEVLKAASSKWNFINFKPGLVGGHCIGVDPYYLTFKAKNIGYTPKIILAGRNINDNMGKHVVSVMIHNMKKKKIKIHKSKILIMGLTFKENCADTRNSGIKSVYDLLNIKYQCKIDLYDPWADNNDVKKLYGINSISTLKNNIYDVIIIAVAHKKFKKMGQTKILKLCKENHFIYDLKGIFSKNKSILRL